MTARTSTYLKARFETGDIPQGVDYEDVFDSYINTQTSAEQSIDSNLRTTKQLIADSVSANSFSTSALAAAVVSAATLYADVAKLTAVSADAIATSALRAVAVTADAVYTSALYMNALDVSANTTTQAAATILSAPQSFIIYANGQHDSVKLGPSVRGKVQAVINAASTVIKIFPAVSARFLVTAFNASLNIPADKTATIFHKGDDRYGIQIG